MGQKHLASKPVVGGYVALYAGKRGATLYIYRKEKSRHSLAGKTEFTSRARARAELNAMTRVPNDRR